MLTEQQIHDLAEPFYPSEHGWVNAPYLLKSAIMQRLNQIDPAWSISQPTVMYQSDEIVVLSANLTVCGITRAGVGTGIILRTKTDKTTKEVLPIEGFELLKSISKAWKAATSDLLPRAATNFGVGAYLRNVPKNLTQPMFNDWVKKIRADYGQNWAYNGGRARVKALLDGLGLTWAQIASVIEPGRSLNQLTDTTLHEDEFTARVGIIAATLATIKEATS